MKIRFTCCNCNESFNVDAKNISAKDKLICPNCGSEFPENKLNSLGNALLKIADIQDSLYKENELGESEPTWRIGFVSSTNEHH